jgi:hypothetical protein
MINTSEADWQEFKALVDDRHSEVCPFCIVRHAPAKMHPYCDTASSFNAWRVSRAIQRVIAGPVPERII